MELLYFFFGCVLGSIATAAIGSYLSRASTADLIRNEVYRVLNEMNERAEAHGNSDGKPGNGKPESRRTMWGD